jgi:hypothetical protein
MQSMWQWFHAKLAKACDDSIQCQTLNRMCLSNRTLTASDFELAAKINYWISSSIIPWASWSFWLGVSCKFLQLC